MKKWSLSLLVVALLFCVTVEGLRSAPETENDQTKSDAKVNMLLKRIAKLEKRVEDLEKRGVINTLSIESTPFVPHQKFKPVNPQLPYGWNRKQFNGLDYFVIPLSATDKPTTAYAR